jgi:citrate lyase subunit beta/citryl-CoA lyase
MPINPDLPSLLLCQRPDDPELASLKGDVRVLLDLSEIESLGQNSGLAAAAGQGLRLRLAQIDTEAEDGFVQRVQPAFILLSGLSSAAELQQADVALSVIEAEREWPQGAVRLMLEVSSPAQLLDPTRLQGLSVRLCGLVLDEPLLAARLHLPTAEGSGASAVLQAARARVVLLAADAGVPASLALPQPLDDAYALARLQAVAQADGFAGLLLRNAAQVEALSVDDV